MARSPHTTNTRVVAAFADAAAARHAAGALRAAGFDDSAITVAGGAPAAPAQPPREREERFIGRLVLIVVAWSIVGTGVGAVMGVIFNRLGIGPSGTGGLLLQVVSWALIAHLLAGMWAGYALLTKGESREPVRHIAGGRAVVSVWCAGEEQRARSAALLRAAGATAVSVYDAEGRTIDAGG
jgi:hypothetical protein